MRGIYLYLLILLWLPSFAVTANTPLPIFDGHIHYNQDVWEWLPPQTALKRLESQGIVRAVVSSTPTEGTERLYRIAPRRVVPFLRPYFREADRETWFSDPKILDYLKAQLDRIPYRGIGEFHLASSQNHTPVVRAIISLARARGLFLLAHTDVDVIDTLFLQESGLKIIWAHSGFDVAIPRLRAMLDRYSGLYLELSFREGIAPGGRLAPEWREFFLAYPDRFLVGMDTYSASRWQRLPEIVAATRHWLAQLPPPTASAIAFGNAARLFSDEAN
jgi:hypothetical protein